MSQGKRALIIGLGRFGYSIVEALWNAGAQISVIDRDPAMVDGVKDRTHAAFVGDATDLAVLESIGAADWDSVVVAFGESFEAAVLCVSALRRLGAANIVTRAENDRRAEVLRAVGATRVVQLEKEMGERVALELVAPVAADLLDFADDYHVVPWKAAQALVGKTLAEANLWHDFGIHVIGIRSEEAGVTPKLQPPAQDYVIRPGDTLLIVGSEKDVNRFAAELE